MTMITKLQIFLSQIKDIWDQVQSIGSIDGGLYVDAFGLVIMFRLLAVLKGYPALTAAEATTWGTAIGALAYSNKGTK